jgi:hypothetical protein
VLASLASIVSDAPTPQPARRLTAAAKAKLNDLMKGGLSVADAMRTVSSEPGAFEEVTAPPPPAPAPPRPPWRGDDTDWTGVVEKLTRLRELDRDRTVFGAKTHEYRLGPPLTAGAVAALEKKWKVKLPPGLRAFYTQVGNGGAGPGYGLLPADKFERFKPATAYPGVEALRAGAPKGSELPANRLLAPLRASQRKGLIAIAHHGCNIYSAVVCTGDVGRVVSIDEDGISELEETLVDHVSAWLNGAIEKLEGGADEKAAR